jgi:DNA-binding transcriptional regulator YhcF (GntR family)
VGTYVVDDEEWLQQFRVNLISQKADAFMKEMKEMGVSPEEIIAHLRHKHPRRKAAAKKR